MFVKPKTVARPPATKAAASKVAKAAQTVSGWEELCALDACIDALKGVLELKKKAVTAEARKLLVERGLALREKPDSVNLEERDAAGSAYIRRRDRRSPLVADELDLMAELAGNAVRDDDGNVTEIPGLTTVEEIHPAVLMVNPTYASDEVLLKRIDKALTGIKGIPEDFIVQQEAETKTVVSETATGAVFRFKPEVVDQLFGIIAGVTLKPVYKAPIERAWEIVKPMLTPDPVEEKAAAKRTVNKMLAASLAAEEAA